MGFVYGMYLTPRKYAKKVDNVFASLNFERIKISEKATGTPAQALDSVKKETQGLKTKMNEAIDQLRKIVEEEKEKLLSVYSYIKRKFEVFNLRDVSAHTKDSFYITGWMQERDLKKLMAKLDDDEVILVAEDVEEVRNSTPPTVIHNHTIFRPLRCL